MQATLPVAISWQLHLGKHCPEIAAVASLLRNDNRSTALPVLSLRGFEEPVAISWQLHLGKHCPEIAAVASLKMAQYFGQK